MNTGSQKSKDKYLQEKVDTFVLRVPKGFKEKIQLHAMSLNKSLNAYITELIYKDMPEAAIAPTRSNNKKNSKSSLPDFLD